MVHKELAQAWWFDSHNLARPSPWLNNTLSELDDTTKQMLKLIDQDADSFAQRAEMYYKKRPVLVDMLGDLYRAHRSLAEQHDLLKHGNGTRHTLFDPSSCTQSWSQAFMNGKPASRCCTSCSASSYDSESEVDDPEQEDDEAVVEVSEAEAKKASQEQQQQQEHEQQVELMRGEIARLKEQNAELQKAAEENAALKAELAGKDDEKREAIRQLASAFDMVREENSSLRERIKASKNSPPPPPSRGLDLKKLARDLFSARLLTAHCQHTGPIVAL